MVDSLFPRQTCPGGHGVAEMQVTMWKRFGIFFQDDVTGLSLFELAESTVAPWLPLERGCPRLCNLPGFRAKMCPATVHPIARIDPSKCSPRPPSGKDTRSRQRHHAQRRGSAFYTA